MNKHTDTKGQQRIELNKIYQGNTVDVLKTFPSDYFDTIVTSPPYWGLRDYGDKTKAVWDGDPDCEHEWATSVAKHDNLRPTKVSDKTAVGSNKNLEFRTGEKVKSGFCKKCGAWYGQLGLEPTLELYLEHMLEVTAELKRVLRPDGVVFWNHGDSYGTGKSSKSGFQKSIGIDKRYIKDSPPSISKITAKSMILQNYRLITHMVDEQGWILRNTIIWNKPNHMPSSVKDRFANAYEPVFMLTKNKKYWFDLDAVRVPHNPSTIERSKYPVAKYSSNPNSPLAKLSKGKKGGSEITKVNINPLGKNPGDVWAIPTQPFSEAHFATYPEKLVEPMIISSCPAQVCKKCGKPRVRITKPTEEYVKALGKSWHSHSNDTIIGQRKEGGVEVRLTAEYKTVGWTDCGCNAGWEAGVVLDPFMGSGTTALVALKNARNFVGIEANPEYIKIAMDRIKPYSNIKRLDNFMEAIQ